MLCKAMDHRHIDKPGDSIECLQAQCQMRDPEKPKYCPKDPDGLPYRWAIGRATAEIIKELKREMRQLCPQAKTARGEKISGQKLTVRSHSGFTRPQIIQGSKADKASSFFTCGHTIATVKYPFVHARFILARQP